MGVPERGTMSTIRETPIASRCLAGVEAMLTAAGLVCAVSVEVRMVPVAAQRPRATIRGGRASVYMAPAHRDAEAVITQVMRAAMRGRVMLDEPIVVVCHAVLPRPSSAPKRSPGAIEAHTAPEDVDNIAKLAMDAASGVLYRDDHRVVGLWSSKARHAMGGAPRLIFEVWRESDHAEV